MGLLWLLLLDSTPKIRRAVEILQTAVRRKIKIRQASALQIQKYWKTSPLYITLLKRRFSVEKEHTQILKGIINKYNKLYSNIRCILGKILQVLTCPISMHCITTPVIATDGIIYEKSHLMNYILFTNKRIVLSPVTREILGEEFVIAMHNHSLAKVYTPLCIPDIIKHTKHLWVLVDGFDY